jgi:hypothetical protein
MGDTGISVLGGWGWQMNHLTPVHLIQPMGLRAYRLGERRPTLLHALRVVPSMGREVKAIAILGGPS